MVVNFPPVPAEVKPIAHLLKVADEHDTRNITVAYWARMAACRLAMSLVPDHKSPETSELLGALIGWLETTKKENKDNEGIMNMSVGQALIEEYALRIFDHADTLDKELTFNKNTVKSFYLAAQLMDILDQFDNVSEDFVEKRTYAKWKAAYIHNCLKRGENPIPGPRKPFMDEVEDDPNVTHKLFIEPTDMKDYKVFGGSNDPNTGEGPSDNSVPRSNPLINLDEDQGPSTSPVTPFIPTNPTPFNTPVTPPVIATGLPPVAPSAVPFVQPISPPAKTSGNFVPEPQLMQKAQKYCKFASSALNYDDVNTAVDNLTRALRILQTGRE